MEVPAMMSLSAIQELSRKKARMAAREKMVPMMIYPEDLGSLDQIGGIPNIGDYRPKGYVLVDTYFVDKTGLGRESEPALTIDSFLKKMKANHAYAIIEEGQFQLYVGEFSKAVTH
jgi:hypothetical protein